MPTWKIDGRYYTPDSIRDMERQIENARAAWLRFEGATVSDDHYAAVGDMRRALGIEAPE